MFASGLGHELPAAFAVVSAFFGGLALGARLLDRIGASERPGLWYAGLETVISVWAFVTLALVQPIIGWVHATLGEQASTTSYWLVAFFSTFIALLPATAAMGGTLAAAENWYSQTVNRGGKLGIVYASNTLGAATGALIAPFALMPELGLTRSMHVLIALNVCIVAIAFALRSRQSRISITHTQSSNALKQRNFPLAFQLFSAGLLGIGFEALGVRIMAQVFEGTVYSFSATLCMFLIGTALGGLLFNAVRSYWDADQRLSYVVVGLSVSVVSGLAVLSSGRTLYRAARTLFGDTSFGVLCAELALALPIYGPATVFMGALFCHLAEQARNQKGGIGWALSINTLGGMLAPAAIALVGIPNLGLKWSGVSLAFGYLMLLPRPAPTPRWVPMTPILLSLLLPSDLRIVTLRPNETIVAYEDGIVASVAVTERNSERNLRIDNRFQMGGTGATALRVQRLQAHLPLLLHNDPSRALFLGVATGITSGAAIEHPGVTVDAVELTPGVLYSIRYFSDFNGELADSPKVTLYNADARRYVRSTTERYDVIVGDLFQPARDGAGFLYTLEHFTAIRERLADRGLFCQWLPLYQMDEQTVRHIVRTFVSVFPYTEAWLGDFGTEYPVLGLLGAESPQPLDIKRLQERMTNRRIGSHLSNSAIREPEQLLGHQFAGDAALRSYAKNGRLNTDDYPIVLFEAPRFTFVRGQPGYVTLRLLQQALNSSNSIADNLAKYPVSTASRVKNFVAAREHYLTGAMALAEGREEAGVDHLFRAVRRSSDFTLAYAQLVNFAMRSRSDDPGRAKQILRALSIARPEASMATKFLERLDCRLHCQRSF